VVPAYAHAKFYLRAATRPVLEDLYEKVDRIVQGAALATGARGSMRPYQNWVENMVITPAFDEVYAKNLQSLGYTAKRVDPNFVSKGSSDVGNVSQVIPTIQPHISISDTFIPGHSLAFVEASCSQKGLDSIALGAKALANTALDLILDPALLQRIKEEHAANVKAQSQE
jgi:metal-dependent amidase/aminoacylase/carboxypeptidase family protein